MKLNNHQKRRVKAAIFKSMRNMVAPDAKMIREDKLQHSSQIMEWEWFCLEYDKIVKCMYIAIEEQL